MKTTQEEGLVVREEITGELVPTAAAARAQHEIQGALIVAKKFPRDEQKAIDGLLKACERSSFAEEAVYAYPRGGTTVEGPSVNMAREVGRLWGNIIYGTEVIQDTDEARLIRSWAWDMQSNAKPFAEDSFKKLIYRKDKGWIVPDERDLRELTNRRAAICERNCLLKLMPKDVIEEAVKRCKATTKKVVKGNRTSAIDRMIESFKSIKVTAEMLQGYLGHGVIECTEDEITTLRQVFQSIRDGNSTWAEYASPATPTRETGTLNPEDLKPGTSENRGHGNEGLDQVKAQSTEEPKAPEALTPEENASSGQEITLSEEQEMCLLAGPEAFMENIVKPLLKATWPVLGESKEKLKQTWSLLQAKYRVKTLVKLTPEQLRDLFLYVQTAEFEAEMQQENILSVPR